MLPGHWLLRTTVAILILVESGWLEISLLAIASASGQSFRVSTDSRSRAYAI
jgi:hypothetical protein